jgi:hypothetical protein
MPTVSDDPTEQEQRLEEAWADMAVRIERRLDDLGVTKAEFLRRSKEPDGSGGISFKTLDRVLDGNRVTRRDKRRALARALEWPPNTFDLVDELRPWVDLKDWDWTRDQPVDATPQPEEASLEHLAAAVTELLRAQAETRDGLSTQLDQQRQLLERSVANQEELGSQLGEFVSAMTRLELLLSRQQEAP